MLSLQEISDRLEIQQLMVDYSNAIDSRDFDALEQVFTADAYFDYRAIGGIDGHLPEIKVWLGQALEKFPHYQHLVGNMAIRVAGATATARTACFNPMMTALPDGRSTVMFFGLWYADKLVRTAAGWRICERIEENCYAHNVPDTLAIGPAGA